VLTGPLRETRTPPRPALSCTEPSQRLTVCEIGGAPSRSSLAIKLFTDDGETITCYGWNLDIEV